MRRIRDNLEAERPVCPVQERDTMRSGTGGRGGRRIRAWYGLGGGQKPGHGSIGLSRALAHERQHHAYFDRTIMLGKPHLWLHGTVL